MNRKRKSPGPAFVEQMARIPWQEFPGHFGGALSKVLVGPGQARSGSIDFRISRYAPNAHVAEHAHWVQEQIYYVLEGEGMLTLGKERRLMRPHDYVYLPPGVRHGFANTGTGALVFFVVTTPAADRMAE